VQLRTGKWFAPHCTKSRWLMALLMMRSNRFRSAEVMVDEMIMMSNPEEHKDGHHIRIATNHPGSPDRPVTSTESESLRCRSSTLGPVGGA
jgi:hypothetical protein